MEIKKNNSVFFLFGAVIFGLFVKFWEPGVGLSSTTYGAFAENILNGQSLFRFNLSPNVFDPFVDHPPLIIWLQALAFKLLGVSSFSLRMPSILLALACFWSLYSVVKLISNERAAVFAVLALLLSNTFMNYSNSGWLDMGMVGFTWLCFYFLVLSLNSSNKRRVLMALGSLCAGFAFLAKGLAAMALLPLAIFFIFQFKRVSTLLWLLLWGVLPIAVFTYFFYRENNSIFWFEYLNRRSFNAAQMAEFYGSEYNRLWYIRDLLLQSHVVFLIAAFGLYKFFSRQKWKSFRLNIYNSIVLLAISQVLLHLFLYSFTNREYSQYLLPCFPWLALLAGLFSQEIIPKGSVRAWSKGIFSLSLGVFILLALLPITVHVGEKNPYRLLRERVMSVSEIKFVRIPADDRIQHSWEGEASYVVWYWEKLVKLSKFETIFDNLNTDEAVAVFEGAFSKANVVMPPNIKLCFKQDDILFFMHQEICDRTSIGTSSAKDQNRYFGK